MFVLPSLVFGFLCSLSTLNSINRKLFDKSMGVDQSPLPSEFAVLQAFIVGLIIPLVSSIVPI
jgi:hypothetical protein